MRAHQPKRKTIFVFFSLHILSSRSFSVWFKQIVCMIFHMNLNFRICFLFVSALVSHQSIDSNIGKNNGEKNYALYSVYASFVNFLRGTHTHLFIDIDLVLLSRSIFSLFFCFVIYICIFMYI